MFAGLLLALGACSALPPSERPVPRINSSASATSTLLSELARVATLSAEQRRRELAELENGRRLDDARRFQLAALLEREDSAEAYERGLKALATMDEDDSRTQALVELLKRSLKARIELKQQTARADELQSKLDQIKALEKSLQQRSSPAKAP
ncbi:MAG: hypothetical protein Q8K12_18680 [Thiobacillus sp.]|nr:hypothetical protein [Thiobacillus sp.]